MERNYFLLALTFIFSISIHAQITLTQSNNPTLVDTNGRACALTSSPFTYSDNYFYRVFRLSDFGVSGDFQISSVEYGQGKANDGKLITLSIYTVDTDDLNTATFTFVGQTTHTSAASDNLSLISKPLSLSIPAGSIIAFEIFVDGNSAANSFEDFLPGYNTVGEQDDSYIKIPDCTFPDPVTLKSLTLPDEYVMNVVGSEVLGVDDFSGPKLSFNPNPTKDIINIDISESNKIIGSNLYNVTGQILIPNIRTKSIDLSNFKSGIYLLEITTEQGKVTKKVVKN